MPPPPVKILTGLYSDGYSLSATYTNLKVRASASVAGTAGLTGAYAATGEDGGVGLTVGFSATTHNAGHISGGVGGEGGYGGGGGGGGVGGVGAVQVSGVMVNTGVVVGGVGGEGGYGGGGGGVGGVGGVGAVQVSGVMVNKGVVVGGVGGVGGSTSGSRTGAGGQGGTGLYVADGDFTNRGVVVGGAGGQGGHGGYISSGGKGGVGVELHVGGRLTNLGDIAGGAGGSNGDTSYAQQGFGVVAYYGTNIVNGSATVTSATIAGIIAVEDILGVITNFGTLSGAYIGSASLAGVTDNLGLIEGGAIGAATVSGGIVVNGDHANHSATIDGQVGFSAKGNGGGATLVNYGQISGSMGAAVILENAYDRLVVEVGSTLDGVAFGGGGTLEFGTGQGHVSGFGTQYFGFGAYVVDNGGVWRVAGSNTMFGDLSVAAGGGLKVGGGHIPARTGTPAPSLMVEGAIANDGVLSAVGGALIVEGAVTGAGKLVINGGFAQFDSTFSQRVRFGVGGGELVLAHSQDFAGRVLNFAPGGAEFDLKDIGFVSSSEATFKTYAHGGVLTVSDGTHTARIHLDGDFTGAAWKVSSDGGGGVFVDVLPSGASAPAFASAMASLGGGGGATATAAADPSRHLLPQMLTVPGR